MTFNIKIEFKKHKKKNNNKKISKNVRQILKLDNSYYFREKHKNKRYTLLIYKFKYKNRENYISVNFFFSELSLVKVIRFVETYFNFNFKLKKTIQHHLTKQQRK